MIALGSLALAFMALAFPYACGVSALIRRVTEEDYA